VDPEMLRKAVVAIGGGPRLAELAHVYAAYQSRLQQHGWADRAGLGWVALESLGSEGSDFARDWPLLIFDGFDDFSAIQLALIEALASRAGEILITLTGVLERKEAPRAGNAHRRFERTRRNLEDSLGVTAAPLPHPHTRHAASLAALESCLYQHCDHAHAGAPCIDLVAATDRLGEVRVALRWLKERIVVDGMVPGEVALLARSITPYRPFIEDVAAEFGLPVRLAAGSPLSANPAVAALLALLALMAAGRHGADPPLPRRGVIDAWRCPYFDWAAALPHARIDPGHAEALDRLARWGRVAGGQSQWEELFGRVENASDHGETREDDRGSHMPLSRNEALSLRQRFTAFVTRISPPAGAATYREFAGWLEDLIGGEGQDPGKREAGEAQENTSLRMADRAARVEASANRDLVALRTLKQVLFGLVWAEEALGPRPVDFPGFFSALTAAIAGANCQPPVNLTREEVLTADVVQGRGLAFRAVALLGMAEGEFPALVSEDHFVRDEDRAALQAHGVHLRPSTESNEAEYFYEAACRPSERLLLTRPRIADNGATWLPSPHWEEVRRLTNVTPQERTGYRVLLPASVASWPELLTSLAQHVTDTPGRTWADAHAAGETRSWSDVARAGAMVGKRSSADPQAGCDGWLQVVASDCRAWFGPERHWSASGLETYRSCPFSFYVGRVLGLATREDPAEDLNDRQRGNIFHRILERTYRETADRADLAALQSTLVGVASQVLDEAPEREGFRATHWWLQTRTEMEQAVTRALEKLVGLQGPFTPSLFEVNFSGQVHTPGGGFLLRGTIDRVDRAPDGRFRIIDYKSGGASTYTMKALQEGKKLQLGLYAAAARDLLGLGDPVSGFYFHIASAEQSDLRLEAAEGGVAAAISGALAYAEEAIAGARAGRFTPQPPPDGCPPYCAAAVFCWHYASGYRPS
jgi:RecB family exonuclease